VRVSSRSTQKPPICSGTSSAPAQTNSFEHGVQEARPAARILNVPSLQMQNSALAEPGYLVTKPWPHVSHFKEAAVLEYVFISQNLQASASPAGEKVPAGQGMQALDPGTCATWPASQASHIVAPVRR